MKKVAVFGKPGSGKSTVSKVVALANSLPLYHLDSISYKDNGELVARNEFTARHQDILRSESWLIDGLGPIPCFNERLAIADTLVYIDLPYLVSYWFVTKRLLKGLLVKPEGWPDGSSIIKGTLNSYRALQLSPQFWDDGLSSKLADYSTSKDVFIIKTVSELNAFVLAQGKK